MYRLTSPLVSLLTVALLTGILLACDGIDLVPVETAENPIFYGQDDRYEVDDAAVPSSLDAVIAANAVVVHTRDVHLVQGGVHDGDYWLDVYAYGSFGEYNGLCSTERFFNQGVPGWCSASYVGGPGDNWLATAGHCIDDAACSSRAFIFDFDHNSDGYFSPSQVFFCSQVVDRRETGTDDWAVVEVDHAVTGRTPVPVRTAGSVEADGTVAALIAVGHPGGMPAKVVGGPEPVGTIGGATVTDSYSNYFESNLDMYAGNSGTMVVSVDTSGTVVAGEGILVRGNADFEWNGKDGCYVTVQCSDLEGCRGRYGRGWEEVTRATRFAHLFAECGNAVCEASESCEGCPADCSCASFCGDGTCDADETCVSCTDDCGPCGGVCLDSNVVCRHHSDCCSGRCTGKRVKYCE